MANALEIAQSRCIPNWRSHVDTTLTGVPFVVEPDAGPALDVLDIVHVYKATAAETNGSFSLREAIVPPGTGVPRHAHHNEDEVFYVLSGEIVIECEGDSTPRRVGSGGTFFGARGWWHAFRNDSSERAARVLILSVPSCGLDQMFAELAAATARGARDPGTLTAITGKYGVTIAGTEKSDE
jgi:mannose-6-phosphate isomerase-like protein (cupin superfamily)